MQKGRRDALRRLDERRRGALDLILDELEPLRFAGSTSARGNGPALSYVA